MPLRRSSLSSLSVVLLCFAVLVGCGGVAGSPNSPGNPTPPGGGGGGGNGGGGSGGAPTTTLQAETANNTSASNSFSAQLNGLPAPANVSKVDTHTLLYSGSTTKIYAGLMGWFDNSSHMNVGYRSDDPQQVHRQVEDMISRGMQGAILDWFGQSPSQATTNNTAMALRTEAEAHPGFEFAIMEDAGALFEAAKANKCDVTTQLLSDLDYINTHFVPSSAYTRVNGRPTIFFFGVDAFYIDWNRVRAQVANNPLFLFRGTDGLTRPISDGAFQWEDVPGDPFHPVSANPFDPALGQQNAFYGANRAGRFVVGSAYRGFNDALAPWGIDRFIHPRCGQTWLDTFATVGKFYSANNQLPALQVVTWNDYEEGTAIEPGLDNCVFLQPSISGTTLNWSVGGGPESTIDHYTVFSSTDGQNLTKLADVPSGTHSLDLSPFNLASGTFTLYVKATGRPSIQNKMSPAIAFHSGDQPPNVNLQVTQTGTLTFSVSTQGSSDPDGSIASSRIDFGDGTSAAGPNATHAYASVGTYDITATVTDNASASAVAVQRVSAKATSPGVTILSPTPSTVVNWPNPPIVASASGPNPITLMRVLVDGTQVYAIDRDTINTVLKIYTGNHQIEVQAVDSTGATFTASVNITAEPNDPPPVPGLEWVPMPQLGPNTVLFCGANWQDPGRFVNAYKWDLGDGTTMFVPGFVHQYPSSGPFTVNETVINEFGSLGSKTAAVAPTSAGAAATPTPVRVQDEKTQKQNVPIRLPQLRVSPQ